MIEKRVKKMKRYKKVHVAKLMTKVKEIIYKVTLFTGISVEELVHILNPEKKIKYLTQLVQSTPFLCGELDQII